MAEEKNQNKTLSAVPAFTFPLILIFFFISGMTGLMYEILWIRMIVKIIGAAPFAVSIVLTVFMGGLGLGSYIAGRYVDSIRKPGSLIGLYGILELIVGVYALLLPLLLSIFKPLYSILYIRLFEYSLIYNALTFFGCSATSDYSCDFNGRHASCAQPLLCHRSCSSRVSSRPSVRFKYYWSGSGFDAVRILDNKTGGCPGQPDCRCEPQCNYRDCLPDSCGADERCREVFLHLLRRGKRNPP